MRKSHASERYNNEPLMCRSLWKRGLEKERAQEGGAAAPPPSLAAETDGDKENKDDDDTAGVGGENEAEGGIKKEESESGLPPLFEGTDAEDAAYLAYNRKYCTNYVRSFFNAHIDDPWFRTRLSALETVRRAKKERARSSAEASSLR